MSKRVRIVAKVLALVILAGVVASGVAAQPATSSVEDTKVIVIVTFRGCEEACEGFLDYIETLEIDTRIELRDIDRDRSLLPGIVEEVRAMDPDLLVTWGTSVTLGMIGTVDGDQADVVTGVPTVFMIVADPIGAGIINSYEDSGRPLITGTRNRVPEQTQMRVLAEYRPFTKIGLVYNNDELNAVLKVEEIRRVAASEGFQVVERIIENDSDGDPLVADIPDAVADIADHDVDFLYLGSSSFLLANADIFTSSALDHGIPLATAYEAMVRESNALIALAGPYYNVGQLAGFQAEQVLVDGTMPGDLDVVGLDRFSVLINIDTARTLRLYPPMLMLRYAEVVYSSPS